MSKYSFRSKELTIRERITDLLEHLTIEEKIDMLSSSQKAVDRLGISEWYVGCEAARGFVSKDNNEISTVFPQPIGMASTFDKELMRSIGEIAGDETRYYYSKNPTGKLMLWGPTVDMERNPLWGRTEEGYGEDPCLAGEMTKEYTIGLAGSSRADEPENKSILDCRTNEKGVLLKTIPTLKHFCANNNEKNRISGNSNVTEELLHEYYYRAFMPALKEGGAHSAMAAYNKIGGVPGDMNPDIQTVLKDKWGMDFAVTDGGAFSQNVLNHRFVRTHAEALAMCIKNGMDTMTDNHEMVSAAAKDALKRGLITESDIDKAVGNVLIGRFRLGEFDDDHRYKNINCIPDSAYARSVNLQASLEQICLLKNSGKLPLNSQNIGKVLIAGPIGNENYRDWYTGTASYAVSIKKAFEEKLGVDNVIFDNGWDIVAVRSKKNGKYMSVSDNGDIIFSSEKITERELFELHDWDDNTYNFKSVYNGKYVTENGAYEATSDTPYAWFIHEWLKPHKFGQYVYFESWHDDSVYLVDDGHLRTKRSCRPSDDRLFEIETVTSGKNRIKNLSKNADMVIFCGGNHPMQVARECYDRSTLLLPPHQHDIVMSVDSQKLIFAVISGYPYAIAEETEHSSAVIYSSHCGAELGNAIAATILGENNPAARCPITWYKSDSEIPPITEYDIISARSTYMYYDGEPLFPFGHGLSYSEFVYSDFSMEQNTDSITAKIKVKNVSELDGDEVVQIYFNNGQAFLNLKLCGFKRVHIPSGTEKTVNIEIPNERISSYDEITGEMEVFKGNFTFMAGASCKDIRCSISMEINGSDRSAYPAEQVILCKNYHFPQGASLDFSITQNDRYVKFGDWGGQITLNRCEHIGCTSAEIYACAPCAPAKIEILELDEQENVIGTADIPSSAADDDFHKIIVPVSPVNGAAAIGIRAIGMANIYKLRFLK